MIRISRLCLIGHLPLVGVICCFMAQRSLAGEAANAPPPSPENLHVYLMLGQSDMTGQAKIAGDATKVIERCYLLNEKNEWEPAREALNHNAPGNQPAGGQKFGPGYTFARKLLEQDKSISIGLVVTADPDAGIDDWLGKSKLYWEARKRAKAAMAKGIIKGVLWYHGGKGNEKAGDYLGKLQTLIANLRADLENNNLPFVAGQLLDGMEINTALSKLPESTHATAVVTSEGLTASDGKHFDAKSQLLLGEKYAGQMLRLQAGLPAASKPPADIRFIDPHVHAMSVTPEGLKAVAKWMEERNIERCIVSPLNHKGARAWTEEERAAMLANFKPYEGRIDRMAIIDPGEVETVGKAVAILQREIADGAVGFGEHYGVDLMFDDPKNLMLYEACEKVGLPVMFHIDQNKNMVEPGMERVDRVLKMFPECKVVAHAYWWRQLSNGACDRQLQEHPNLYADMSGTVVVNVLNRDRKYAREFIIRNQDKLLWATDEGWWSFGTKDKQMNQHYTFFEELNLPAEVRHKIYRGNAEKVYGLKPAGK